MFSAVPMCQMRLMILDRDKRAVLQALGRMGVMHLAHAPVGEETSLLPPVSRAAERERCAQILRRVASLQKALALKPADNGGAEHGTATDCDGAEGLNTAMEKAESQLERFEASLESLTARQRQVEGRQERLAMAIEQMRSFGEVNLPFSELDNFSFLHFAIGSLPSARLDGLRESVAENVVLIPLPRNETQLALVAVTTRTGRFALQTELEKAGFKKEALQAQGGGELAAALEQSGREQQHLDQETRHIGLALTGLAAECAPVLEAMQRSIAVEQQLLDAEEQIPRTQLTRLITGWVPDEDRVKVADKVRHLTQGRCVVETVAADQAPADQVPVLMRHSRLLRPFGMLVAGYGTPGYRDIEPTLFVALTYMLMFGMMFGDVGHGAVLAVAGAVAIIRGTSRKVRDVGTFLIMTGIASAIFGMIYGSYFGLASMEHYALWKDPLSGDPMDMMKGAIVLGVIVISTGLILNTVNCLRKRDWVGGFLGSYGVAGAILYWGVLGLVLKHAALREHGLLGLAATLVIVIPLAAWFVREPLRHALEQRRGAAREESGGFLIALMESAVEAFEAMLNYMANTISFVRLAAYAMSHAAVLMATFVMAREVEKISVGGGFLSVLVIIAGNLVAILLEGLIAAVQAMRLEYYEFFSKFFSGGGQAYTPFHLGASPDQ